MAKRPKKQQEEAGKSGPQVPPDPGTLRRVFGALHGFTEWLEAELEDAIGAARLRQLQAARHAIQAARFLDQRYIQAGCKPGAKITKPTGLTVEPDLTLGLKYVDADALRESIHVLAGAVEALEPFEGERFLRKPIGRQAKIREETQPAPGEPGPESAALAALEGGATALAGVFRDVVAKFAERVTSIRPGARAGRDEVQGMSPQQVAKRLRVSADKVRDWINKGELKAVNVANRDSSRPRWRISEDAIRDFENKRQASTPPSAVQRRKKNDDGIIEFF